MRYELTVTPKALEHLSQLSLRPSAKAPIHIHYLLKLFQISKLVVTPNLLGLLEDVVSNDQVSLWLDVSSTDSVNILTKDKNDSKVTWQEVCNSAKHSKDKIIFGYDEMDVKEIRRSGDFNVVALASLPALNPIPSCYILAKVLSNESQVIQAPRCVDNSREIRENRELRRKIRLSIFELLTRTSEDSGIIHLVGQYLFKTNGLQSFVKPFGDYLKANNLSRQLKVISYDEPRGTDYDLLRSLKHSFGETVCFFSVDSVARILLHDRKLISDKMRIVSTNEYFHLTTGCNTPLEITYIRRSRDDDNSLKEIIYYVEEVS